MRKIINIPSSWTFKISWIIFLLAVISNVYAQPVNPLSIAAGFEKFNTNKLQEKIYAHTDKDMYLAGEIIWFKLYCTTAGTNKSLDLSKIAYVEILDKNQKPVLQAKILMEKGSGNGSFYLPVSLPSGAYQFRAYTNWMKNFSPDYFFEKNLRIINSLVKPEELQADTKTKRFDVQFFPEGGQIVENFPGKVAFRAINDQGNGVLFNGTLLDQDNTVLLKFKPLKFGIGSFSFIPAEGKTYRALIELPGETITREIPVAKTGYVIQLNAGQGDQIRLSVQTNLDLGSQKVHLFAQTRQEKKIQSSAVLNNGKAEFLIDKSAIGEGISQFTVFNNTGQAVAERLYFKRPSGRLLFNARADQQRYGPRKKVTISLDSKDENRHSIAADASVSVFVSDSPDTGEGDIFNYLWLKSDLKGNIESPDYYLKNDDAITNAATDNLMLTHGWRRFVWEDILTNTNALLAGYLPEIDDHIISGRIIDTRTDAPAANIMTYLAVPGKILHLYGSRSDSSGQIRFYTRSISGPSEIVVQTNILRDSVYRIEISDPFSEKYSSAGRYVFNPEENLRDPILAQSMSSQVQNIFAGNKLRTFFPALTDSSNFYSVPDKRYLLDNFVRFNTMEEVLREYVTEVPVIRQKDEFSILVRVKPHPNDLPRNVEPLILLDGVPVFDKGTRIMNYDPKKVRELDVVSKKYFLGPLILNSIINFKTYKGNLPDFQINPKATVMDYEGRQLKREFYSPLYETDAQLSGRIPDFRNVLYWSPDIKIDTSGRKTISFYTSDQENKYKVVLQGLSPEGKAGSAMFEIEVKK